MVQSLIAPVQSTMLQAHTLYALVYEYISDKPLEKIKYPASLASHTLPVHTGHPLTDPPCTLSRHAKAHDIRPGASFS